MKIPPSITEEQLLQQIDTVVNRIAPRYVFYGYTVSDIKQEAFIICVEAMERYDPSKPLENFLSVNLSNRLKNFVRDNFYVGDLEASRAKVSRPGQLTVDNYIIDDDSLIEDDHRIDYLDMIRVINNKLPASMRADYLKMINDVYVSKGRREDIIEEVKEILREHRLYEGDKDEAG